MTTEEYWKKRCELAEAYIEESPCDPDIYPEQWQAYNAWEEFKKLDTPAVSECKICKPDGCCSMFNSGETKCFDILYSKCKFYKR